MTIEESNWQINSFECYETTKKKVYVYRVLLNFLHIFLGCWGVRGGGI